MTNLINGLGGEAGFGESTMGPADDTSVVVNLVDTFGGSGLGFLTNTFSQLSINHNGNLTFGPNAFSGYSSTALSSSGQSIIAAYWADVLARTSLAPTPGGTSTGSNRVWYDQDSANQTLTVTWDDIGGYNLDPALQNAFQLQLIGTGNGYFDLVYRYETINWTNNGPPRAGFSVGNGVGITHEFAQSGNGTAALELDTALGNTGAAGYYRFSFVMGTALGDNLSGAGFASVLSGGNGDDSLVGGPANDTLDGGAGDDTLRGGPGNDSLVGGADSDTASYSEASDTVNVSLVSAIGTSSGPDDVDILVSIENIIGSQYSDTLTGNAQANKIFGLAGYDILAGLGGNDTLDGGADDDTADYSAAGSPVQVNLQTGAPTTGGDGADTLISIENLWGSAFADELIGDAGRNYLYGNEGNDTLVGNGGDDEIYGYVGNDSISGGAGYDILGGGDGDDTLDGGGEDDRLNEYDWEFGGDDSVMGGDGSDSLYSAGGFDTLEGGNGNDDYTLEQNAFDTRIFDTSGYDTVYSFINGYALEAGLERLQFQSNMFGGSGNNENNTLDGNSLANTMNALGGSDYVYGYEGDDTLDGGAGSDSLYGGSGDDVYFVDSESDQAIEDDSDGDDQPGGVDNGGGTDLVVASVDYTLGQYLNNLDLTGNAQGQLGFGNDLRNIIQSATAAIGRYMAGEDGNDTIIGNSGNDTLLGGNGADLLTGGAGADQFCVTGPSSPLDLAHSTVAAPDRVTDFSAAAGDRVNLGTTNGHIGEFPLIWRGDTTASGFRAVLGGAAPGLDFGTDVLQMWMFYDATTLRTSLFVDSDRNRFVDASDFLLTFNNDLRTTLLPANMTANSFASSFAGNGTGNVGNDTLVGGISKNNLSGLGGDDALFGSAGSDTLDGGTGNDALNGGTEDDSLSGGSGADTLDGSAGNDRLDGGDDADNLQGGLGNDTLLGGNSADLLNDIGGDDSMMGDGGNDTISSVTGSDTLDGGAEDDLLNGGVAGSLLGGEGNDRLFSVWHAGQLSISGGNGNDELLLAGSGSMDGGDGNDLFRITDQLDPYSVGTITASGGAGLDTYQVHARQGGVLIITDFVPGAGGDMLDVGLLLDLSAGPGDYRGSNPFNTALGFLRFIDSGSGDTWLQYDHNGVSGGTNWQTVVILKGLAPGSITTSNMVSAISPGGQPVPGVTLIAGDYFYHHPRSGGYFDDTITGLSGNDWLVGNGGNDSLDGGSGDDILFAGGSYESEIPMDYSTATNKLFGGNGNDDLYGSAGADILDGGADTDTVSYGYAKAGVDANLLLGTATGGAGLDTLNSIEVLIGSAYNDSLSGGLGNDILNGGAGADVLTGNAGADLFSVVQRLVYPSIINVSSASAPDRITDFNLAEGDRLEFYAYGYNGYVWRGDTASANFIEPSSGGAPGFTAEVGQAVGGRDLQMEVSGNSYFSNFGQLWMVYLATGNRTILFMDQNKNFVVDSSDIRIDFDGDVRTQLGPTAFAGSRPIDVRGTSAGEVISGSANSESLMGVAGNDQINGLGGNDSLFGGSGNDTLDGGSGRDFLIGGSGSDLVVYDNDDYTVDGGDGVDTLLIGDGVALSRIHFGQASYQVTIEFTGIENVPDGTVSHYSPAVFNFEALEFSARTSAIAFNGEGNDDRITATAFDDSVSGGVGNDSISGGAGFDTLMGGIGNDTLNGANNADSLDGGEGNDKLYGGKSADRLDGGGGDDVLFGQVGDDSLYGGDGVDTIDYSAGDAVTVNLALLVGGSTVPVVGVFNGTDILQSIENVVGSAFGDNITGNLLVNVLTGGGGNDTLSASDGADTLFGGDGNDVLAGGAGGDSILGGIGNDNIGGGKGGDQMFGEDGNDTLYGNLGNDQMTGGAGADKFVFNSALSEITNVDTIMDFQSGIDQIQLSASIFGAFNGQINQTVGVNGLTLLYNSSSGVISYDADGVGGAAAVKFAVIGLATHPGVMGNDFMVVA